MLFLLAACKTQEVEQKDMASKPVVSVYASMETDPVSVNDDAADDACIWINKNDVMQSRIIGTNKKEGLVVYRLDGKQLFNYPVGRVNNVDIRDGFILNGKKVSVVTSSNRTSNTISIHVVNPITGALENAATRPLKSRLKEVYGLGMYKSKKNDKIYVFICGKDGGLEQWELFAKGSKIDAKIVREIVLGSQCEGIVADDFHGKLYIGEENKALWKFDAEPSATNAKIRVISTKSPNMKADFEGVTIYDAGNGEGYVILSSQGNNSYAVFDRITNQYQGSFKIDDAQIDGTYDTDGIDVTSVKFGEKYSRGFFIAQDGANTKGKDSLNQNFKIVNWNLIKDKLKLR